MAKTQYPISREFFPYSKFTPRIDRCSLKLAQTLLKTPGFIYRDPDVDVFVRIIMVFCFLIQQGASVALLRLISRDLIVKKGSGHKVYYTLKKHR